MIARTLIAFLCLLFSATVLAKSTDSTPKNSPRKPASKACTFSDNNGWEIRIDGNFYFGLNGNGTADEKIKISEMARNLAQAGVCQF